MNRIFITIGPITIYWYSFLIFISILISLLMIKKEIKKTKLNKDIIFDLLFYLIPVGILGARLYYVIFNFDLYKNNLINIIKIWEGGLAIYGAVIAGIIFIIYYCKKKKQSILLTLDLIAPCLILGQAIGRWGNFFNGEAHGAITTLDTLKSMHLPNFIIEGMYINGNYYIPTFLYESLWCIIGFSILIILKNRIKYQKEGLIVSSYFVFYSIGRFFIEGLRTDSLYLFNIRVSQLTSIGLFLIGIIGIILISRKGEKNEKL